MGYGFDLSTQGRWKKLQPNLQFFIFLKKVRYMFITLFEIIEKTVDKVRTTGILEINGIYSPKTVVWFSSKKSQFPLKKKSI